MKQEHIILHLSLIDGIGPATIQSIVSAKPSDCSWNDVYTFSSHEWMNIFHVSARSAKKLVDGLADAKRLDQELHLIETHAIPWATMLDESYPSLLKHIHAPPPVLYWQGALLEEGEKRIGVVGSRRANRYGQQVINTLIPSLVAQNMIIVSGGAIGADSMAHQKALDVGGKTAVILGSGLLEPYPSSNKRLFELIVERGGTLISSFPLTTTAMPGNFPARNRIIAGVSHGCVVVQAARKSGARITAQFALEEGREVFAVPGPINDTLSHGCHALIQEGAKLVNDADDILCEFGYRTQKDESSLMHKQEAELPDDVRGAIIVACAQPCSIDDLMHHTKLPLSELQELLFDLQLAGSIQQDFTGMWVVR